MPASKSPSITDLARLLNLSRPTVARALSKDSSNTHTRISEETRQKVLDAAQKLGYRVNASARSMREKRFNNIGFFVAKYSPLDYSFSDIMSHGVATAAEKYGQNIFMIRMSHNPLSIPTIPKSLREKCMDGLIVQDATNLTPEFHSAVESAGIPVVYMNEMRPTNAVYIDDFQVGRDMTHFLINEGYKKITMLAPKLSTAHYSHSERTRGYCTEMEVSGLTPSLIQYPYPWQTETEKWITSNPLPEAFFCMNDQIALRLQTIFYKNRIRVPDDVAIAGIGGELIAAYSPVPLTTIQIPFCEMAQQAVEMLMGLIHSDIPSPVPSQILTAKLRPAASTQKHTST